MNSWKVSFHKFVSFFLILLVFVSQTVQVSFFDEVSAKVEDYRDIVSIFVDSDTYGSTKAKILQYAEDIQTYLGSTRVSLHIVPSGIGPEKIASINEKLYYEGDGKDGVSQLVGTILIGNIPIPMVDKGGKSFPSLYPYVDFEDKFFVFNPDHQKYEYSKNAPNEGDVEIWHGVINPALGGGYDRTRDIPKISAFLDKTHDFYEQKGIFNNARYTEPPRVFYYDGFYEQKSLRLNDIFAYGLSMANIENIAYERFSKYLMSDIVDSLNQQKATAQTDGEKSLLNTMGVDPTESVFPKDQIAAIPDIQTKVPIQKLIKQFYEIVNSKSLGDIRHMVYNAGRYNDGKNVRVDQPTLHITTADRVSLLTLKEANTALEQAIDANVSTFARKIAIFDEEQSTRKYGLGTLGYNNPTNPDHLIGDVTKTYTNYFYGKPAKTITDPLDCTIARGSTGKPTTFGKGVLVEANNAYDINSTELDADKLKKDTEELVALHRSASYSCFNPDQSMKLDPYWAKNTVLRLSGVDMGTAGASFLSKPVTTSLINFSEPIFRLSGMDETTRFSPASPLDCSAATKQYSLLTPYTYSYGIMNYSGESASIDSCTAGWPEEWNLSSGACDKDIGGRTPRYTCNTVHEVGASRVFATTFTTFGAEECVSATMKLNNAVVKSSDNPCNVSLGDGDSGFINYDNTTYKYILYHTIPSIVYHKSPTDDEIAAALKTGATPSLSIDMNRYVEFQTPKGNLARITYPNFFRFTGSTILQARTWLKSLSDTEWTRILSAENSTNLNATDAQIANLLRTGNLPASPIDWNDYISDEVLKQVIESRNWLYPDIPYKYTSSIESSLSFSKNISAPNHSPFVPDNPGGYEIAYLGLGSVDPTLSTDNPQIDNALTDINLGFSRIDSANVVDASASASEESPNQGSYECGGPEGVDLFKWFPAIICWLQHIQVPKIQAGTCGATTIGANNSFGNPISPSAEAVGSSAGLKSYLDGSTLVLSVTRNSLFRDDALPVDAYLIKNNSPVLLPLSAQVEYSLSSPLNGVSLDPGVSVYSDGKSSTILSVKSAPEATTTMQAKLTYKLPDGTLWSVESAALTIRVRDEILDVSPTVDAVRVGSLDATSTGMVGISVIATNGSGEELPLRSPFTLDIYDDVDGAKLPESGISFTETGYQLPFTISKKPGVYRLLVTDSEGRVGETTFSVHPGEASQLRITPLSTLIVAGGRTPVSIQILDRVGNPTVADISDTEIEVVGGYIIDEDGNKKTKMTSSIYDGSIFLNIGSDTPGSISIRAHITDSQISESEDIGVISGAQVTIEREKKPVVGEDAISVRFQIVDPVTEVPISGFSSPIALSFPEDGGTFSEDIVQITDGVSNIIKFTPGHKSGDHLLSLDIPGIGKTNATTFSVAPGIPMRIGLEKQDIGIRATLLDRYGNVSESNLGGFYSYKAGDESPLAFTNGVVTIPRKSGYLWVRVPAISGNKLTVKEDDGTTTDIPAISENILYIPGEDTKYVFAPDYNALYTVLAGGSFLSEGSDTLYQDAQKSSSLAVTTLLDTPYTEDSVLSFFPGGGYRVSSSSDRLIRPSFVMRNNFPVIEWYDDSNNTEIAESMFHLNTPTLTLCSAKDIHDTHCDDLGDGAAIRLIHYETNTFQTVPSNSNLSLLDPTNSSLFTINKRGIFTLSPLLKITPRMEDSYKHLVFDITLDSEVLATLLIATDMSSVTTSTDPYAPVGTNTISTRVLGGSFLVRKDPIGSLGSPLSGMSLLLGDAEKTLDTEKLGPSNITSIGALPETPGVGWQDSNVSLLSFSAGDTVGTATRWTHTFTMVNLGDPVAHLLSSRPGVSKEGIDRSVGSKIISGAKGRIRQVVRKDMNNDGYEDLVIWYTSGHAELILNLRDRMRSRGYIMHVADLTERGVDGGDFTGDHYADMVYLTKSGSIMLLDNSLRKWTRKEIKVLGGSSPTGVSQMKIFDMDHDRKDDIVYLSESGELAILYGTDTPGEFTKKVLDASLGVEIDSASTSEGGAIYFDGLPQLPPGFENKTEPADTISPTILQSQIYYQRPITTVGTPTDQVGAIVDSIGSDSTGNPLSSVGQSASDIYNSLAGVATDSTVGAEQASYQTYVQSDFVKGYDLEMSKTYKDTAHSTLYAGDPIEVKITLTNKSTKTLKNIEYLDTIPSYLSHEHTESYRVGSVNKPLEYLTTDDYDVRMMVGDMAPGETVTLSYILSALPASYGEMKVGNLEGDEGGTDDFGDVGFNTKNTCGAEMILWRSTAARDYMRGTKPFLTPEIPATIKPYLTDGDKNGTPDYVENMSVADRKQQFNNMQVSDNRVDIAPKISISGNKSVSIGFDAASSANIEDFAQKLADGLSCGFGGGGCMSMPLNWAPLAPGNSPLLMGMPLRKDWLTPEGGPVSVPIFSALTRMDIGVTPYCVTFPMVWPISPLSLSASLPCSSTNVAQAWIEAASVMAGGTASSNLGAGGRLGIASASNFLRIFVTPTLTLGMGTAICMGATAKVVGNIPPKGVWPATPGGNCIVITKPMNMCKSDGSTSDGDIAPFTGLGSMTDSWNAGSCKIRQEVGTPAEKQSLITDMVDYIRNPANTKLPILYQKLTKTPLRSGGVINAGSLLKIGGGGANGPSLNLEIDSTKPFSFGDIVKVKNKSVEGFPDFLMSWVRRQMEEVTNALFSPPNLFIVPIRSFGQNAQVNGDFDGFTQKLSSALSAQGLKDFQSKVSGAYTPNLKGSGPSAADRLTSQNTVKKPSSGVVGTAQANLGNFTNATINGAKPLLDAGTSSANSMRAAYEFIGKMPFIRIERTTIPINVPWILQRDLEKYGHKLKAYADQVSQAQKSWCTSAPDKNACLNSKGNLQASAFVTSIQENIRTIEGYKKFPEKLQKYLTWKQRYLAQIVCNIDAMERMTGGWISDNGRRFRAWVEFYILLKAILKSWNVLPDLFNSYTASCSVCRNERYDLKYFIFKIISALIPQLPIITFPRWPDIVLDLSDIRLGITLRMPEFKLNVSPIRLPNLPSFSLPNSPGLGVSLPAIPILKPIPNLPDLPDLPSLPTITLPDLPPPPKLPKLFGSVVVVLDIFKLISKIMCLLNSSPFVPEWVVGEMIAEKTARNTTLPIDFLKLDLPQVSMKFLKEIRVSTHINYEIKTDFITEMAKASVKPINSFTTDMTHILPTQVGKNINVQGPGNINVKVPPPKGGYLNDNPLVPKIALSDLARDPKPLFDLLGRMTHVLEKHKDTTLSTEEFRSFLQGELTRLSPTADRELYSILDSASKTEDHSADKLTEGLLAYNTKKFSLLRHYLDTESESLSELQKVIDALGMKPNTDLVMSDALFTSQSPERTIQAEQAFTTYQSRDTTKEIKITNTEIPSVPSLTSTNPSEHLLAAANVPPSIASEGSTGYAPNFEGIFISTPNKNQTRLFDYVTALRGNEVVDVVDIDQDGDDDYITLMDNSLYIKYTDRKLPPKIIDHDISISSTALDDLGPTAVNYFSENTHESGFMNLDFSPAHGDDTAFRLELYDHMLEWDSMRYTTPDSSPHEKTTVDLIVDTQADRTILKPHITTTPLHAYIAGVNSPSKTVRLFTPSFTKKITGDAFALSPGKVFYTGENEVQISYRIGTDQQTLTLGAHASYSFDIGAQVGVDQGSLYIFDSQGETIITDPDTLRGIPIVPEMRIFTEVLDRVDIKNVKENTITPIQDQDSYYAYSLGTPQTSYSIHIPYQNGWYSARMFALGDTENTKAGITLLAPQSAADRDAPLIDLPDSLDIPVYTEKELNLQNTVGEQNSYTLSWDNDIMTDTNNNGIPDDDFESAFIDNSLGSSRSNILMLGPYKTVGDRTALFQAVDEFGNTSSKDVTLHVYAPIPHLQNATLSGSFVGALEEDITGEPIDFIRVRAGSPLTRFDSTTRSHTGGLFAGSMDTRNTGIEVDVSGKKILLDDRGWIGSVPTGYSTVVDGATRSTPMKISVLNASGSAVYSTYMIVPPSITPKLMSATGSEATQTGLLVLPKDTTLWVDALPTDPSFAGGGYFTSQSGDPIAAIHHDGNIYLIAPGSSLEYRKVDTSIHISILLSGKSIGEVIYRFEPLYTIQ